MPLKSVKVLTANQQVEMEGFAVVRKYSHDPDGDLSFDFYGWAVDLDDDTLLCAPGTLKFTVPEHYNMTQAQIEGLQKAKAAAYANFMRQDAQFEERIQNLLALAPPVVTQEETADASDTPPEVAGGTFVVHIDELAEKTTEGAVQDESA